MCYIVCVCVCGRKWVAVREVVSLGRDRYRYSDDQIEYHYTQSPQALTRALSAAPA